MAQKGGRKVGRYTSPHLMRFAERIEVDGQPLSDDELTATLTRVMDEAPDLTFFEVATLTAFLAFREHGVDLAVLEVGLGGRLDATNVIPAPRIAAITRVAFDHQAELGGTLTAIATEKAGIIKAGSAVITGRLHPDARQVIEQRALEVQARLVPLGSPEPIAGAPVAYPRFAMVGTNLAVAVTAARELGITPDAMIQGIEAASWPGRNELLQRDGEELTLLDSAHNPDGAIALHHSLDPTVLAEIESRRQIALVFGALKSKNWKAMLQRLDPIAGHRVYVAPPVPKAEAPDAMARVVPGIVAANVREALAKARELVGKRGLVVVTGSSYLVGAARAFLLEMPTDPPIAL
jgi:dihydrofolate synthase/folylpolyglutamate synthase